MACLNVHPKADYHTSKTPPDNREGTNAALSSTACTFSYRVGKGRYSSLKHARLAERDEAVPSGHHINGSPACCRG